MADVTLTAAQIRPMTEHGAIVVPGIAGSATDVGNLVFMGADGEWDDADGDVAEGASAKAQGVVVQSYDGETVIAAGSALSVCVFGPVAGFTDLTAGANYYLSDTAGAISDDADTYDRIVGWGMQLDTEVVLFVHPQQNDPSSA